MSKYETNNAGYATAHPNGNPIAVTRDGGAYAIIQADSRSGYTSAQIARRIAAALALFDASGEEAPLSLLVTPEDDADFTPADDYEARLNRPFTPRTPSTVAPPVDVPYHASIDEIRAATGRG